MWYTRDRVKSAVYRSCLVSGRKRCVQRPGERGSSRTCTCVFCLGVLQRNTSGEVSVCMKCLGETAENKATTSTNTYTCTLKFGWFVLYVRNVVSMLRLGIVSVWQRSHVSLCCLKISRGCVDWRFEQLSLLVSPISCHGSG